MDLGPDNDASGGGINDHNDGDEPLFAQYAAILEVGIGDFAHARAVDIDEAQV
ncbi:unannotated protein [freshwater metagenome]|uniref:Unannotated protein n=1 Tax=freshwater metagenome TaxID=449393 RepID=A0A6J7FYM9_9ZZZZ